MTLETSKLLTLIESLHDALLEIQIQGDATKIRDQISSDFANPSFQRGYLMGIGRLLRCEGIPTFLSGAETQIITSHINRIGMVFNIQERKAANG